MRLLDLFSGIGGFSLAAKWLNWETVAFCEQDKFCQKILRKNFGQDIKIYDDIKTFPAESFRNKCDILTGGFPCQPFSQAGLRLGNRDARSLWSAMFEIIKVVRPNWVVAENVTGIVRMELDNVLSDLESTGYTCGTFIIPAYAVGAEHRRDRVWIVGNTESGRFYPPKIFNNSDIENKIFRRAKEFSQNSLFEIWDRPNTGNNRNGNGLSATLDRPEKADQRHIPKNDAENRIKALGNAIVPQVAYQILKKIDEIEKHYEFS